MVIFFFALIWITESIADQTDMLNKINLSIQSIQASLRTEKEKQTHAKNTLKKAKKAESKIMQQLNMTKKNLLIKQKQLEKLKWQTQLLQKDETEKERALTKQIRAVYLLEQQPYLKFLLDPHDIAQSQRMIMYYHYISKAQLQAIAHLQKNLSANHQDQQVIQQQYTHLASLKQNQLKDQQTLQSTQDKNKQLITVINRHIQTKSDKLEVLIQDKTHLEKTIHQLNTQLPTINPGNLNFTQLKGKIAWPTEGHIRHAFGTQIAESELTWEGTIIAAPAGQVVHAIAAGRVIFANQMPGYGLLLIINHGNGYMSLYGRNGTLAVKTNDWVTPNETIATVGNTGEFDQPTLYFSIRHNTQPLNPARWCR